MKRIRSALEILLFHEYPYPTNSDGYRCNMQLYNLPSGKKFLLRRQQGLELIIEIPQFPNEFTLG